MENSAPRLVGYPGGTSPGQQQGLLPASFVLRLQQTVGNREVVRLLVHPPSRQVAMVQAPTVAVQRQPTGLIDRLGMMWRRVLRFAGLK